MTKEWSLQKGDNIQSFENVEGVLKALKNWSPFTPILVSKPQSDQFLPPTCHHQLATTIVSRYKARVQVCIAMTFTATLITILCLLVTGDIIFLKGSILFALIIGAVLWDYCISFKSLHNLTTRTLFMYWLINSKYMKRIILGWLIFIIALATIQALMMYFLSGREAMFILIGTVHSSVLDGEVWRLFVGPFLHSSVAHFLINATFLMLIGPLSWRLYSFRAVLILVLGSAIGALFSTLLATFVDNYPYDSYAGLSPGIFALYGAVFIAGTLNKTLLPQGIALHLGFVALISMVSAMVYYQHSADASHWAGFILGALLSLCFNAKKIVFTDMNANDTPT
ncbi:rhomboid family intramembrane serine protease [Thalassotalea aquiviva]|uniref:rhomboid family intramembrane serine protease n=1 Tax=Thalassotalea aquiviva TaxID=3242415 RepID=UPI003529E146